MTRLAAALAVAIALAAIAAAQTRGSPPTLPQTPAPAIFRFSTDDLWLNLHHFLYVLGRAEARLPDATRAAVAGAPADAARVTDGLSADEHHVWDEAVTFYANGPSRKDLVFDRPLATGTGLPAGAGDRPQRAESPQPDAAWRATLLKVAPIYRKAWWPAHRAANIGRRNDLQSLADRHGAGVLAYVERIYGMKWPDEGYPVHFSGWVNWAGAYSTIGNLLVMSSLDRATAAYGGLEIAFHEGMHQ